ncbi:PREDICTED: AP-4 complex subunit epsilon-1-like [Branchiostoma belcheri]|uniref:AP-4 complex subunit epsilon-1-like n=1 Tax=Branchiostoma belcheri TaxID=7741 RepID=A0A6P4YKM6_BRABE|nr:PREDICTED: AP-4 complex subunit epsilon-1-like [Branchiostoma belcheri]
MTEVMERTLASLPMFIKGELGGAFGGSRGFQSLIKAIGESQSKHEEERIMKKEVSYLQQKLTQPDISKKQMKELLVRLVYCHMLGHDITFGYIHALKLAQQGGLVEKRVGYLAVSLFLHEDHELIMLLINTIQKDLKSTNILHVCMGLTAVCALISTEMIPALLPMVEDKLQHPKEVVRKKAIMALHRFYLKAPNLVQHIHEKFRKVLCDRDPGVMGASLNIFYDLIKEDVEKHRDLTNTFACIMKQVIGGKLTNDFTYHSVPAPWIQVQLLRIMGMLGAGHNKNSEQIYAVLDETLDKSEINHNMGYAVLYECVRTVTAVHPNPALLEKAAQRIGRFLRSRNNNLRYLGITALTSMLPVLPGVAAEHQMVVIECLDDPDETLQRKTLELLYRMTGPPNVTVICDRLISHLSTTTDTYLKSDLVTKITQLAERFAPSNEWFITTMNQVFELGSDLVPNDVAQNLLLLLAEGTDSESEDAELRLHAVQSYLGLVERPHLPDILVQVSCWTLGEYSYLLPDVEPEAVLRRLLPLLEREYRSVETMGTVFTAITKLCAQMGRVTEEVVLVCEQYLSCMDVDIRQRAAELLELQTDVPIMQTVLPLDASCEDLQIDPSLSFLDEFVSEALGRGAAPYKPRLQRQSETMAMEDKAQAALFSGLNFKPYDTPLVPPSLTASSTPPSSQSKGVSEPLGSLSSGGSGESSEKLDGLGLRTRGVRKIWSKDGCTKVRKMAAPTVDLEVTQERQEEATEVVLDEPDKSSYSGSAQVEPSPVVASPGQHGDDLPDLQEDRRKQQLASALFSGLQQGGTAQTSRGRGILKTSRRGKTRGPAVGNLLEGIDTLELSPQDTLNPTADRTDFFTSTETQDSILDLQDVLQLDPIGTEVLKSSSTADKIEKTSHAEINLEDLTLKTVEKDSKDVTDSRQSNMPENTLSLQENNTTSEVLSNSRTKQRTEDSERLQQPDSLQIQTEDLVAGLDRPQVVPTSTSTDSILDRDNDTDGMRFDNGKEIPTTLPEDLMKFPHSVEHVELCSDEVVRLTLCKVWKPEEFVVVIFLTNHSGNRAVTDVCVKLEPSSNFQCSIGGAETSCIVEEKIAPCSCSVHSAHLTCKAPALSMHLGGELSYKDHTLTNRRLFFTCAVHLSDVVRPLELTTEQYGEKWPLTSHDKRLKLETNKVTKVAVVMDMFKGRLGIHAVDIIGNEGIASGTLLQQGLCLLHVKVTTKVNTSTVELWVKSNSQLFTECVARECAAIFR